MPIAAERGDGVWLYGDGARYLDLYGGHAVAGTGHCHPHVVQAIRDQRDSDVDRHMAAMSTPIVSQHLHFYLPEGVEREARTWYVTRFGGTVGRRLRYDAVDLPGINLNFSISSVPNAPPAASTKGRTLDHIGFEVRDLAALCRRLESAGVKFDVPYARRNDGVATAMLTDPWGASIELTEGLRGLRP